MFVFESSSFASQYDKLRTPSRDVIDKYSAAIADLNFSTPPNIADAGAGTGSFINLLQTVKPNHIYAIEPATGMFSELNEKLLRIGNATAINDRLPLETPITDVDVVWCSDVAHLFKNCDSFVNAIASSFPKAKTVIIRQTSPTILALVDWVRFFPGVYQQDARRHFEVGEMIGAFNNRGWRVSSLRLVDESFSLQSESYVRYYESKPFSGLHLASKEEFDKGLQDIRSFALTRPSFKRVMYRWLYIFQGE